MLDAIKHGIQRYYDQIPSNTLQTVGKSIAFSFSAALISQGPKATTQEIYYRPMMAAGLAALAALLHAAMTPIFNIIFENQHENTFHQECVKTFIEVGMIRLAVSFASSHEIDILGNHQYSMISTNLLKSILHIFPVIVSLFDQPAADAASQFFNRVGLDTPDGANTTYLVL